MASYRAGQPRALSCGIIDSIESESSLYSCHNEIMFPSFFFAIQFDTLSRTRSGALFERTLAPTRDYIGDVDTHLLVADEVLAGVSPPLQLPRNDTKVESSAECLTQLQTICLWNRCLINDHIYLSSSRVFSLGKRRIAIVFASYCHKTITHLH